MAFKLNKSREPKGKGTRSERDSSLDRVTINFGLSPEVSRVRFIKRRNDSHDKAGQSRNDLDVK